MYPGNHTESEILSVPRNLKTRPGAPETHLAYITDDEAELLKEYKPGTPHEGAAGIPNYDTWGIDTSGNVTGGSTAGGGGGWSGDYGGGQSEPEPWSGGGGGDNNNNNNISDVQDLISVNQDLYGGYSTAQEQAAAGMAAAGMVTGSSLSGMGFWNTSPVQYPGMPDDLPALLSDYTPEQLAWHNLILGVDDPAEVGGYTLNLPENVYYSTYGPGAEGFAYNANPWNLQGPNNTGYVYQNPVTGEIIPLSGGSGGGGGGGGGGWGYGYGYGGGRGGSGGGGGGYQPQGSYGDAYMRGRWGQSDIQRRYIDKMRGYNRGGIVSLC